MFHSIAMKMKPPRDHGKYHGSTTTCKTCRFARTPTNFKHHEATAITDIHQELSFPVVVGVLVLTEVVMGPPSAMMLSTHDGSLDSRGQVTIDSNWQ